MVKRSEKAPCSGPACEKMSSCKVEALISIDERGQMVLPKEIRDKADIRTGDKLALVSWEKDGKVCCFTLTAIFAERLRYNTFSGPAGRMALK